MPTVFPAREMDRWMKFLTGTMTLCRLLGRLCPWMLPDGVGKLLGAGTWDYSGTDVLCNL